MVETAFNTCGDAEQSIIRSYLPRLRMSVDSLILLVKAFDETLGFISDKRLHNESALQSSKSLIVRVCLVRFPI